MTIEPVLTADNVMVHYEGRTIPVAELPNGGTEKHFYFIRRREHTTADYPRVESREGILQRLRESLARGSQWNLTDGSIIIEDADLPFARIFYPQVTGGVK